MAKLLKISVILMLLLSGAALAMGYLLFKQREMLKGRTQRLETTVKQVASLVETGDEQGSKLVIPDDQLETFKQVPGGPQPMDIPLNQLVTAAKYQLERLNVARTDLADTKQTLSKTEDDLKTTVARAEDLNKQLESSKETIVAKEAVIKDKEVLVQNLEREREELDSKVEQLESKVNDLQVTNRDLNDKLSEQASKLEQLAISADPTRITEKLMKGRQGMVLHVDPKWNFVIFDISPESADAIVPDLELIVHRGDRFVGKVKVANVDANLAVAEIMSDWEQAPVEKDDEVIY